MLILEFLMILSALTGVCLAECIPVLVGCFLFCTLLALIIYIMEMRE